MGSFEKLVVATVFFLSAVVLAVSLTSQKPTNPEEGRSPLGERLAQASDAGTAVPGAVAPESTASAKREPAASPGGERGAPQTPALPLLSSSVQAERSALPEGGGDVATAAPLPAAQVPVPTTAADGRLTSLLGLQRSPTEGRWLYTWAAGDTWTGVAQRLYGSGAFAEDLRVANDDANPSAGTFVVVPEQIGSASRSTAADARLPRPAPRPAPAVPAGVGEAPVVSDSGGSFVEHVVQNGETLSSISERYYGTAARWTRVYDANRDRLANPDRVPVGTRLRIP